MLRLTEDEKLIQNQVHAVVQVKRTKRFASPNVSHHHKNHAKL